MSSLTMLLLGKSEIEGSNPTLALKSFKETIFFSPAHARVKIFKYFGSLCDREVACSASDSQGSFSAYCHSARFIIQCWINVGPASAIMIQHQTNISGIYNYFFHPLEVLSRSRDPQRKSTVFVSYETAHSFKS